MTAMFVMYKLSAILMFLKLERSETKSNAILSMITMLLASAAWAAYITLY